jgi:fructose-1,6-bisphosphatase/inositol monophosphatase family enzyme
LIALHDEHGPAVGVVSLPGTGEVVAAGRGMGATLNGKPCSVSAVEAFDQALITSWGFEEFPAELLARCQQKGARIRGWSDAYGWALLASGRVDIVIDPSTKLWDIAPMQTIIPEAGGKLHGIAGATETAFAFSVGTNGRLHDEALELLGNV